jgi:hypothetical protein
MYELGNRGVRRVRPRPAGGFWRRQFDDAPTPRQRKFDVTFGIVMPVVCFALDPIVFKTGSEYGGALYPRWQLYAYTISVVEMVALCAWLLAAGRAGRRPAALAGMLMAGAGFAFVVGMAILPFSLIGLLVLLIGLLGFVPFLTAFVYLRNGWRAAGALGHAGKGSPARAALAFVCGFVFALAAPAFAGVSATVSEAVADGNIGVWLAILSD